MSYHPRCARTADEGPPLHKRVGDCMRGLKGKRVLITGGASGIGAAAAARFLEEGSHVCVLDRDASACEHIKRELRGLGEAGISEDIVAEVTDIIVDGERV